jgi:hypothetical protein
MSEPSFRPLQYQQVHNELAIERVIRRRTLDGQCALN